MSVGGDFLSPLVPVLYWRPENYSWEQNQNGSLKSEKKMFIFNYMKGETILKLPSYLQKSNFPIPGQSDNRWTIHKENLYISIMTSYFG